MLSALCAVHCLALPVLVLALPMTRESVGSLAGPWVHDVLGIVLPLIAAGALIGGYRKHGRLFPMLLGLIGISALWVAMFEVVATCCDHTHAAGGGAWGTNSWITTVGSAFLVTAHMLNTRAACPGCTHAHEAQVPMTSPTPSTRSA